MVPILRAFAALDLVWSLEVRRRAPPRPLMAAPVHNRPLEVDGSDADGIGFSALPVRESGTPPSKKKRCAFYSWIFPRCWGGYGAVLVKRTGKYSAFTRC